MPIYEYACDKCGHEFEAEQRITDPPVKTCPKCRARRVKRLISRTSFVLKGGGWYSDLYASPGGKDKADAKEAGKDAAPGASTGDAKPDEKKSGGSDKPDKPDKSKGDGKSKGKGKGSKAAA